MWWGKWCWRRVIFLRVSTNPSLKLKLSLESHTELYSSTHCFGLPSGLPKLNHLTPHIELSSIALHWLKIGLSCAGYTDMFDGDSICHALLIYQRPKYQLCKLFRLGRNAPMFHGSDDWWKHPSRTIARFDIETPRHPLPFHPRTAHAKFLRPIHYRVYNYLAHNSSHHF